jgi:NAD(P)-dependent dehydrogenase (short-subunit alcohol dehydrogenase family)
MYLEKFRLDGKIALITGASRGIGEAIAMGFAEAGARVALASRKLEALSEVAHRIAKAGGDAYPVAAHVGKIIDIESLVERVVNRYGGIDILVNNAGTNPVYGAALDCDESAWEKIIEVNMKGAFFLVRLIAPHMEKRGGGCIINMASVAGISPMAGLGVYSISKAGLIMMTKVFAKELAPKNIRVNAIAPGVIQTRFSEALWKDEKTASAIKHDTPMNRVGMPDEIVGAALYLASEASSFTTGETILVDGGSAI